MWLIQLVSTEVAVLVARNIVFGILLLLDILNSSNDPSRVNFVLYGSIFLQLITIYITLYLWTRITLRKKLASREWLVEMLGEDVVRYLRIPKE
jgi:hypothetical protein